MYLVSLHGHGTSAWPGSSGAPTECRHGHEVVAAGRRTARSTSAPIRVMIRIEATTYAESVISTPSIGSSASSGPMQNGMTYIVRPRMQPAVQLGHRRLHLGRVHPVVGRARRRPRSAEQMKVRSSTRATSSGSEAAQNELGFFSSFELDEGAGLDELRRSGGPTPRRSRRTTRPGRAWSARRPRAPRRAVDRSRSASHRSLARSQPSWRPLLPGIAQHTRPGSGAGVSLGFGVSRRYRRITRNRTSTDCRATHKTDQVIDSVRRKRFRDLLRSHRRDRPCYRPRRVGDGPDRVLRR